MCSETNKIEKIETNNDTIENRKNYKDMTYEELEHEFVRILKSLPTLQSNRVLAMAIKSISPDQAEEIGKNIKDMRRARQIKQSDLADAIGVSKTIISRYERGEACPSIERLLQIAEVLDLPLHVLLSVSSDEDNDKETLYDTKPNKIDLLRDLAIAAGYKVSITNNYKNLDPLSIDFSIISDDVSFPVFTYEINDFYSQIVDYFSFMMFRWMKEQLKDGEED